MHYKQMEKPDRDYTHAMRAEDEYRQLIQQFSDSKLVPEAKQRLREVQEVLAERQYRIGRFYFLRGSYPAAIARLKSLADTYPLYSQSEDVLMMLGHSYEAEATLLRNAKQLAEGPKVRLIKQYDAEAGQAYARLIERYPLSEHVEEARSRLKELGLPVPTATQEAIAQYKAEEQSRSEMGRFGRLMSNFHKAPDNLPRAAKLGEPTLVDPQQTSAPQLIQAANKTAMGVGDTGGNGAVTVEKATGADATKNDPVPRSDSTPSTNPTPSAAPTPPNSVSGNDTGIGELTPNGAPMASGNTNTTQAANGGNTVDGATGTQAANTNSAAAPPQAPPQVNDITNGSSADAARASTASSNATNDEGSSSSKKKKKKGLKKIVPF